MNSYDPPEEGEGGFNFDLGVEKGITEQWEFSESLINFDRQNYILFGLMLCIPVGVLTGVLFEILFPKYQRTAGGVVRWTGERIAEIFLTQLATFDAGKLFLVR